VLPTRYSLYMTALKLSELQDEAAHVSDRTGIETNHLIDHESNVRIVYNYLLLLFTP
jgi:hypothetical protein